MRNLLATIYKYNTSAMCLRHIIHSLERERRKKMSFEALFSVVVIALLSIVGKTWSQDTPAVARGVQWTLQYQDADSMDSLGKLTASLQSVRDQQHEMLSMLSEMRQQQQQQQQLNQQQQQLNQQKLQQLQDKLQAIHSRQTTDQPKDAVVSAASTIQQNLTQEIRSAMTYIMRSVAHPNASTIPSLSAVGSNFQQQMSKIFTDMSNISAVHQAFSSGFQLLDEIVIQSFDRQLRSTQQTIYTASEAIEKSVSRVMNVIVHSLATQLNRIQCNGTAQRAVNNTRLTNGTAGRLEVYYNGTWGTVCDDDFDPFDTKVVCYSLGFGFTGRFVGILYGPGTGQIWLDNVNCYGIEPSIDHCQHGGWGVHNCGHGEDVSISCV